ncbi:hypothetical protein [Fimbriiglobus ruber]|uniref:Uncharacterized protein n=1 Tax=Fimbriiglobus ruber TaxID=1908690 RepID=A0A225E574_9BACT|nr:hypothetical protein [Fimbriiglobus ruber]OWK43567.1 hypothetical protein FRUB_03166 [Fimbriiglobus ruber]
MLEILILWALGKKIARMTKERGRAAWPWVILLIVCWYGGALAAVVAAGIAVAVANPNNPDAGDDMMLLFIGAALAGAIGGALFTFGVVSLLPNARDPRDDEYDDDEDYRHTRRRRYDDEDVDDRPREHRGYIDSDDRDGGRRYDDDDRRERRY